MLRKLVLVLFVFAVAMTPVLTEAADSSWKLRARVINISPDDSSDTIVLPGDPPTDTGSHVAVDSATTLEVDVTYMFNQSLGLELIAAYASHDLSVPDGVLAPADAGTAKVLPPTLTLQYFFNAGGKIHPYIGVGVNYTTFGYDISDDVQALGITDIDLDSSFGFAGDVGVDIDLGGNWLLNVDAKYIDIATDASLKLADGSTLDTVAVDINPWVFGVGVGYKF